MSYLRLGPPSAHRSLLTISGINHEADVCQSHSKNDSHACINSSFSWVFQICLTWLKGSESPSIEWCRTCKAGQNLAKMLMFPPSSSSRTSKAFSVSDLTIFELRDVFISLVWVNWRHLIPISGCPHIFQKKSVSSTYCCDDYFWDSCNMQNLWGT